MEAYVILIFATVVIMAGAVFAWNINSEESRKEEMQLSQLLDELRKSPLDTLAQSRFLRFIQGARFLGPNHSVEFYNLALKILAENPGETRAKTFALEVGRWHYGRIRPDKKLTIYDEQALQNDILVRSS